MDDGGTPGAGGRPGGTPLVRRTPAESSAGLSTESAAAEVFAAVYVAHYRELVQMAALLTGSASAAEDLVQDAFVRVMARHRVPDLPLAYLRTTVVNLARSRWRRARLGADKLATVATLATRSAEPNAADGGFTRLAIVAALRELPARQREVVVLRFLLDLPVQDVAAMLGIGAGTVKSYTARAMEALRPRLEDPDESH